MNLKFMQQIIDVINQNPRGQTIKNLMDNTHLSRGTIKSHLDVLIYTSQVDEVRYAQNVKVYFANIKKVKNKVSPSG